LLVKHCGRRKFDQWPVEKLSYRELFQRYLELDPFTADSHALCAVARQHGIDDINLKRRQWLDLLLSLVIQPALPAQHLTFVCDFPADQAALARIRPGSPPLAERFELYLGCTELANGYQELTDAVEQKQRFDKENVLREERGLPTVTTDHHLVTALEHGLGECAGVALGVDRLLKSLCDADTLNEVIAFPLSRA
jgi:lysyl-tRNA synthetase class 2